MPSFASDPADPALAPHEKALRIRLVSDRAQTSRYRVYDADSGAEITNVLRIALDVVPDSQFATATLTLGGPEVDAIALAEVEREE